MHPVLRIVALAGIGLSGSSAAGAELRVEVHAPSEPLQATADSASGSGELVAWFRLHGLLDEENGDALGEGVPATVILIVDLWRERSGWWDQLVHTATFSYEFERDLLDGSYTVTDPAGSVRRVVDRSGLRTYLQRVHQVPLGAPAAFAPGSVYYLSVKAILRPLRMEDLQEVDAWLSGDVTEGKGGGGLLGIPRALARLVIDLSGLGMTSAAGRSPQFVPRTR